jgi:hypothetical protein
MNLTRSWNSPAKSIPCLASFTAESLLRAIGCEIEVELM